MTDKSLIAVLKKFETEGLAAVRDASDLGALEKVRVQLLGRKEGSISVVLRGLSNVPPDERPTVGQEANRVKEVLSRAIVERESSFIEDMSISHEDLTLPSRPTWEGAIHPITQAVDEISRIFRDLGFTRARGPEADTEWYNFEALNTPLDHPAADEQDTLYLTDSVLLRSHTSPVQMRTMEKHDPPIRIIAPGWVYRRDTYDATHTPAFMQVEGLVIDGVSRLWILKPHWLNSLGVIGVLTQRFVFALRSSHSRNPVLKLTLSALSHGRMGRGRKWNGWRLWVQGWLILQ